MIKNKYNLEKTLLFFIGLDFVLTPWSLLLAHMGIGSGMFWHFFKIPFLFTFLTTFAIFITTWKNSVNFFQFIFGIFIIFASIYGIYRWGLSKAYISHLYFSLLAFFGFFAGRKIPIKLVLDTFKRRYTFLFLVSASFGIANFISYKSGTIHYFGISTNLGIIFLLAVGTIRKAGHLNLVTILLTGKRTVLIASMISYFIASLGSYKRVLLILTIIPIFLYFAFKLGLLNRIVSPIKSIIYGEDFDFALYVLLGGREFEIQYAVLLFQNALDWMFGVGYGFSYEMPLGLLNNTGVYRQHYTHVSLFSWIMLYGLGFTTFTYAYFLFLLFGSSHVSVKKMIIPVKMIAWYMLIASFAGATILVDSKFWLVFGMLSANKA